MKLLRIEWSPRTGILRSHSHVQVSIKGFLPAGFRTTESVAVPQPALRMICTCYGLLALFFFIKIPPSTTFIIWVSVVVVMLCNFVMMLILHFAMTEATAYVQIASNIFTDLLCNLHTLSVGRD
jgi:hypothetical protein